MRMENMGNLFVFEGWEIASGEKELVEVGGVGVDVSQLAADSLPTDDKMMWMECLGCSCRCRDDYGPSTHQHLGT